MPTAYSFKTKITSIREHFEAVNWRMEIQNGEKIRTHDQISQGWYITLEGSRESIYVGDTKPDLAENQKVTVAITPIAGG